MDNVAIPQQFRQQRPMPATTNAEKRFTAYVRCQTPEHYALCKKQYHIRLTTT